VAEKSYLPANKLMLDLIREFGNAFRISYSISGTALEQLQTHVPEVIRSFQALAETGQVEFIAETYAHSLACLENRDEFIRQVDLHSRKMEELFGHKPLTFRNTELIYSDIIGEMVAEMGFHTMLTEGAKHILGWKSPNYMYCNNLNPKLKVLLRNFRLSDDLTFRFSNQDWSEWPLTTDKFVRWLNKFDKREEVLNLFLDYETIGEHQWKETGIFDFFRHLPATLLSKSNFAFKTPEDLYQELQPVSAISVPYPISWADEERDLTAWKGNELQDEAIAKLYSCAKKVRESGDPQIERDWLYLQTSNHFYYMCTKWFSAGEVHKYFNPYNSPYEAFINYMNVLSDFMIRMDEEVSRISEITEQNELVATTGMPGKKVQIRKKKVEKTRTVPKKKIPEKNTAQKREEVKGTTSKEKKRAKPAVEKPEVKRKKADSKDKKEAKKNLLSKVPAAAKAKSVTKKK
jgi:alpha-amylase